MNGTIVFTGIVIFVIISWLTGFVNTLNEDVDVNYGFQEKALVTGDKSNTVVNSKGDEVLLLSKLSLQEKKKLWESSIFKNDMLALFPQFSEMRYFIKNHIEDDDNDGFKQEILEHINDVELEYIGGSLTGQSAKASLSKF